MMRFKKMSCVIGLIGISIAPLAHANLVTNGDFSQDMTDWTITPAAVGSEYLTPASGMGNSFWFGAVSSYNDTISQSIATVAGATYQVTFNLNPQLAGDSAVLGSLGTSNFATLSDPGTGSYSYKVVAPTSNALLSFAGRNGPSWTGITDITVSKVSPVPEPETDALLAVGLMGIMLGVRKKSRPSKDVQV